LFSRSPALRRRLRLEQVLGDALHAHLAARMQQLLGSEAGASAVARLDQGTAHLPELVDELVAAMLQPPDGTRP
jgi:hypothetical protein